MTTRQRQRRQERRRFHNERGSVRVSDPALEQLGIPQRGVQSSDSWIERFWRAMHSTLKAW